MPVLFDPDPIVWVQETIGYGHAAPFRFLSALGTTRGILVAWSIAFWLFGRRSLYALLALVTVEAVVRGGLAMLAGVDRPDAHGLVKYERISAPSFPSGHVSTAAAVWGYLGVMTPLPLLLGVAMALGVALSRLYLGAHYLADVIAALALGGALAWAWTRVAPRLLPRIAWGFGAWLGIAAGAVALVVASGFFYLGEQPMRWQAAGLVAGAAVALPLEWHLVRYRPVGSAAARLGAVAVGLVGLAPGYAVHLAAGEGSLALQALTMALGTVWALLLAPALFARLGRGGEGAADRPKALATTATLAATALALVLLAAGWGGGVEPRLLLDVEEEEARLPGLPPGWEGARIALVADLQVGMWGDNVGMVERVVERLVRDRPAAILVAGDFVYGPRDSVREEVAEAAALLAPLTAAGLSVYAVLGNHDWDLQSAGGVPDTARARAVEAALKATGIPVLRNRSEAVGQGGDELWIVGLGSRWAGEDRPGRALASVPGGAARVVLMHHPDSYAEIPAGAAPLALAGHTHGGQVRLPGLPSWSWIGLARSDEVHADGWIEGSYGAPGNRLYVNRGIGFSIVPVRINAPPELTYFTLRRGGAGG